MSQRKLWWSSVLAALSALVMLAVPAANTLTSSETGAAAARIALSSYGPNPVKRAPAASIAASAAPAQVDSGLVLINTDLSYQNAVGAGTGIVLNPDGLVLTNNHVVEGATRITATSIGTGRSYSADVIGYDRTHDIAVVQLRGATGLPTAPLGNSSQLAVGDSITGIGNAGGQGLSQVQGTVTGLGQTIVASDDLSPSAEKLNGMIEVAANLRPGDSGGPLVNNSGQVIGVDTAGSGSYRLAGRSGAQGFAIPIDTALSIANQIQSGAASGSVHIGDTALLGVGVGKAQRQGGLAVGQVMQGSPADQAGIAPGDVITGFDGTAVTSATTLTDLLDQHHPGNNVNVSWVDQSSQQHSATVTLTTGPVG